MRNLIGISAITLYGLVCLSQAWAQSDMELLELEQQVQQLKERVYKAKANVKSVEDAILKGELASAKAVIEFENHAETLFELEEAQFFLDGELIHQIDGRKLSKPLEYARILDRSLPSGEHKLRVRCVYRGSSRKKALSPFKYFQEQSFSVEETRRFFIDYGKTTAIGVRAFDKGYIKEKIENRIGLEIQVIQDWGVDTSS